MLSVKRYEIMDLFRGIAIFLVIINHIPFKFREVEFPYLIKKISLFGTYGVQLFYIVSAFVLLVSLTRIVKFSLKKFLKKRLYRILPIFYLGILIHILYFSIFDNYNFDLLYFENIILNIFFINNFIPPSNDLIAGGATITTEVNFYFLLPLIFFLINNYKKSIFFSIIYLIILFLIDIFFKNLFPNTNFGEINFYRTIFVQLYVFSLGVLLFHLFNQKEVDLKFIFFNVIFFLFFSFSLLLFDKKTPEFFYFRNMVFVSNGFFIILCFSLFFKKFIINNFFAKIFINLGKYSFTMYIFHWIVIDFMFNIINSLFGYFSGDYLVFTIIVIYLTYQSSKIIYPVEIFFIKLGKKN